MGIPRFASWISKKYPNMVLKAQPENVEGLYIDMNGVIHPCCHDEEDTSRADAPDEEKIERVCNVVEELVEATRPTRILYLAMDGVAPRAKMNQQRSRRYTAASERFAATGKGESAEPAGNMAPRETSFTEEEQQGAEKALKEARESLDMGVYGGPVSEQEAAMGSPMKSEELPFGLTFPPTPDPNDVSKFDAMQPNAPKPADPLTDFDSNCISPGTTFMDQCSARVKEFIQEKVNSDDPLWQKLMVVWSDTQVPGEGEHKVIDFLRTQASHPHWLKGGAHVIVGLDADLILLCLSLHLPNIFIMRDSKRSAGNTFKPNSNDVTGVMADEDHAAATQKTPISSPNSSTQPKFNAVDPTSEAIEVAKAAQKALDSTSHHASKGGSGKKYEYYDIGACATSICTEMHTLAASLGIDSASLGPKEGKSTDRSKRGNTKNAKGGNSALLDIGTAAAIDDFVVMATMMGNDFMPRLPSAFCGNSVMDNFMEIYVRVVLPHGSLSANGDVKLDQLERFLRGYAKMETMWFRKHMATTEAITFEEAAAPLDSSVDDSYRALYYNTTSIKSKCDIEKACVKYVEGLRFVWRYYSTTSQQCSWTWFYPYHHAPFALDLAKHLAALTRPPAPPPLEAEAPSPYVQLLCILPPTSCKLLPQPFRSVMVHPPKDLRDTFCTEWVVDFAAANGKSHLSTVMLPFADLPLLTTHVSQILETSGSALSNDEKRRAANTTRHDVFVKKGIDVVAGEGVWVLHGDVRAEEEAGHFTIADTAPLPHGARPAYSVTTFVKNLPVIPDLPLKLQPQREPPANAGKRLKGKPSKKAKEQENAQERDRGMNLVDFIGAVGASIAGFLFFWRLFAGDLLYPSGWFSLGGDILMVFFLTACSVMSVLWVGFGVHNPRTGSNIVRNMIRDAYVDWLCAECLSMNFARNEYCFQCEHPFVEATSWAVFSSKLPQSPPQMDPNHRPYCHDVHLEIPTVFNELAAGTVGMGEGKGTKNPVEETAADDEANVDMM